MRVEGEISIEDARPGPERKRLQKLEGEKSFPKCYAIPLKNPSLVIPPSTNSMYFRLAPDIFIYLLAEKSLYELISVSEDSKTKFCQLCMYKEIYCFTHLQLVHLVL